MSKYHRIALCLYLLPCLAMSTIGFGHDRRDTLLPDSTSTNVPYALLPVQQLRYTLASASKVWIGEIPEGFSYLRLRGGMESGKNIPAQEATKRNGVLFDAEGSQRWNKAVFWGRFSYARQSEDSTRLRHQTRLNPDAPVYFGSLRNNHYDRETYEINVAVQRPFMNGKIPVTAGVDYRLGNHYANNDPRGQVADFMLDLSLGMGYVWTRTALHLTGMYGYGRERASVGFKNDTYTKNIADSLYVNWRMLGYGYAQRWISNINYNNDRTRYGAKLYGKQYIGPDQTLYFNLAGMFEEQFFVRYRSDLKDTYEPLDRYDRYVYSADVQWFHDRWGRANRRLSAGIRANVVNGDNDNSILNYANYRYRSQDIRVWSAYQSSAYLASIDAGYRYESRSDASASQSFEYAQATVDVEGGRMFGAPGKKSRWLFAAATGYTKNTQSAHRFVNSNLGNMALTIAHHDALYYGADQWRLAARAEYLFSTARAQSWRIGLRGENMQRLGLPVVDYAPYSQPGRNRRTLELYVYLYL